MSNMKNFLKETPISEITLRRYEKPTSLSGRDLIKKTVLSLGLLQPGDSRDVIVDVLQVMLTEKKELGSEEIRNLVISQRKELSLNLNGTASSNVRRQIKRLRDIFILQKKGNFYSINETVSLAEIFSEKIEPILLQTILARVKEYMRAVDERYLKKEKDSSQI